MKKLLFIILCIFINYSPVLAVSPVFYSLSPFGTGTIETGAGNVSITSGVATLTVEQTGNIGVGCCIEYNSLKAYIAPNRIGFDSGGTAELLPDTKIEGGTSGATGIVRFVEVLSGTWAGGTAAGWIYFEKTTGTFQNDEQINRTKATAFSNIATVDGTIEGNIGNGNTEFVVKTATGSDASNQTATAVTSVHHEFASLALFESGFIDSTHINDTDLTNADVAAFACCYYDHDDSTADTDIVDFDFGTTGDGNYLMIFTPRGGSESINNQRHVGVFDDEKFLLDGTSYGDLGFIRFHENYTYLQGIQIRSNLSSESGHGMQVFGNYCRATCNIFLGNITGTNTWNVAIENLYNGIDFKVINNLMYGWGSGANQGCIRSAWEVGQVYYNTLSTNGYGLYGTGTSTNNAIFNNTTDIPGSPTITYCAGDDSNFDSGTGNIGWDDTSTDWNANFTAYSTGDFSVKDTDADIYNAGSDLSSEGIWRDIVGTERSTWDIGAFEYVVPAAGNHKVIMVN